MNHYPIKVSRFLQMAFSLALAVAMAIGSTGAGMAVEEGRPSSTAQSVCAFRAIGAHDPDPTVRNPDHLAEKLLGQAFWDHSGLTYYLREMKAGRRALGLPTLYWITARTLHVDALLKQAVQDGIRQVVILGAGYDSRAYRLHDAMPGVTFFEADFPATQEDKLRRLTHILGTLPAWVRYAPIDFNKQTLKDVLQKAGYRTDTKTFFIWEGVVMYLEEAAVANTLRYIAKNSAPGSQVFFDYMYKPVVDGDFRYPYSQSLAERVRSVGEPWTYGLEPYGAESLARKCGLVLVPDLGPKEFTRYYLMGSDGVQIGEPLQFLSLALAKVPARKKGP